MRATPTVLFLALAACGGNVVVDPARTRAGAGGAATTSTSSGTGGGCITPTVGEACSSDATACQPADPCCAGYEWGCVTGAWQQLGLGCACRPSTFACGTTTCSAGFYCEEHPPGILPPDGGVAAGTYTCTPLPASCESSLPCGCIDASLSPSDPCSSSSGATCTEDASGNATIICLDV